MTVPPATPGMQARPRPAGRRDTTRPVPVARRTLCPALVFLLSTVPFLASGAAEPDVRVTLADGQTLRDLAQTYLGDPNLWIEILRANGLASAADARPGLALRIPVAQVGRTNRALKAALDLIGSATKAGAKVFAADQIDEAIDLHEQALVKRRAGDWAAAADLAGRAERSAQQALDRALKMRNASVEALLSDRQGDVEGRRQSELVWTDRPVKSALVEEERLRTLSSSTAQITFRDESRLRLSANSEAVIVRMHADPLERTQDAKVTLIEGDFYALLAGKSQRKSFELEVPNVQTQINSTAFWVKRDSKGAKFTNYDQATLEVASRGNSVTLGQNEGTVVPAGRAPANPVQVLTAPAITAPDDDATVFNADAQLAWGPVPNATGYWLEVGHDPAFQQVLDSRWGVRQPGVVMAGLSDGSYFWRVAALDRFGLPGARSDPRRFNIKTDTIPPYLAILEPAEGSILRDGPIVVRGATEPGATLSVQGAPLAVGTDGAFRTVVQPVEGRNELRAEARDPAGNRTVRATAFLFAPAAKAAVTYDPALVRLAPNHFVTGTSPLALAGVTEANARITIRSGSGPLRASAFSDGTGRFQLAVPVEESDEALTLTVTTPNGAATDDGITVTLDREAPRIELDEAPPAVTREDVLLLRGHVEPGAAFLVNGRGTPETDGRFKEPVRLNPGENIIEMRATDRVGNSAAERWNVVVDQDPPELLDQRIAPNRIARGGKVTVEVKARDRSGLRQTAQVTVAVGDGLYTDYLRLNEPSQSYQATLTLPPGAEGPVALKDIVLEDYVGNTRRYRLR